MLGSADAEDLHCRYCVHDVPGVEYASSHFSIAIDWTVLESYYADCYFILDSDLNLGRAWRNTGVLTLMAWTATLLSTSSFKGIPDRIVLLQVRIARERKWPFSVLLCHFTKVSDGRSLPSIFDPDARNVGSDTTTELLENHPQRAQHNMPSLGSSEILSSHCNVLHTACLREEGFGSTRGECRAKCFECRKQSYRIGKPRPALTHNSGMHVCTWHSGTVHIRFQSASYT